MGSKKILATVYENKFNLDRIPAYHLSINIGHGLFKVCCIERATHLCLFLAVYNLPVDRADPSYLKGLEQIYNENLFLNKDNWHSITLSISNQKYTLLPHLLLSTSDLHAYLHVACGMHPSEEALVCTHALAKMSLVFSENSSVLHWFRKHYSGSGNFQMLHQANAVIQGMQLECSDRANTALFTWLEASHLHILVYSHGKLCYCNIFSYDRSDDLLRYLSAVLETMQLERKRCSLQVGGLIEPHSLAYAKLKNYMPQAQLKTKIKFLHRNIKVFKASQTSPMLYYDLLSGFLCHPNGPKGS